MPSVTTAGCHRIGRTDRGRFVRRLVTFHHDPLLSGGFLSGFREIAQRGFAHIGEIFESVLADAGCLLGRLQCVFGRVFGRLLGMQR